MNNHKQTDLLFLDFSKAFDTVPHRRLLNKLIFYGIQGPILQWISSWLTKHNQRVAVDGEASNADAVKSGVSQRTLLGPLMFLVYINAKQKHLGCKKGEANQKQQLSDYKSIHSYTCDYKL